LDHNLQEPNKPDRAKFVSADRGGFISDQLPWFLLVFALSRALVSIRSSAAEGLESDGGFLRFTQSAPYATAAEVKRRFGFKDSPSKYEITKESFRVIVPKTFSTNSTWGLLVWISPSDDVQIPSDWLPELGRHRLLFVGAGNSGNNRAPMDRARLALDATSNMCRQFKIDRQRIYIAGFSGGARMASMIGVAWPDVFTGTFCVCGANFYRDVKTAAGGYYGAAYTPDPRYLPLARRARRFVLLTGEHDMNRENTKTLMEKGFLQDGFSQVLYLELPGMKHAVPGAVDLNTALEYLDTGKKSQVSSRDR